LRSKQREASPAFRPIADERAGFEPLTTAIRFPASAYFAYSAVISMQMALDDPNSAGNMQVTLLQSASSSIREISEIRGKNPPKSVPPTAVKTAKHGLRPLAQILSPSDSAYSASSAVNSGEK
jgi:hypothetical protein